MAVEKKVVVREGYEVFYENAQTRLANIETLINEKVEEYRAKLVEEAELDKARLEHIIADCTEEVEVEVPDTETETETETEAETEQQEQ